MTVVNPFGCARYAWLTLGNQSVYLEDPDLGYFCTSLDLGFPTVRAVVNNRPDQHGIDDWTALWGERAVTASITAVRSAGRGSTPSWACSHRS